MPAPEIQAKIVWPQPSGGRNALLNLERIARKRFRQILIAFGTEGSRFYRQQLKRDIRLVTRRRTGRLLAVRVRKRTRQNHAVLVEDFPRTAYPGGQYAYVVSARRKFISHSKGAVNAHQKKFLSRAVAVVAAKFPS